MRHTNFMMGKTTTILQQTSPYAAKHTLNMKMCVINMNAAYNQNNGTVRPLSPKAWYHHKKYTITIHLQIRTYRCMQHIILVNAGLEHTLRRFAPMLQATTTDNIQVKYTFGLNLEPTVQDIHGNDTETKHQLIQICTCICVNYFSLVMCINEPSPGRIIRMWLVIY